MAARDDQIVFSDYYNTVLTDMIPDDDRRKHFHKNLTEENSWTGSRGNLSMVSTLYLYTGTPPHAYGTQAPKVAETVKRAYSFNKKKENREMTINGIQIQRLHWEKSDGPFPFGEIHGNFIVSELKKMTSSFVKKNHHLIDSISERVINEAISQNSDVLTKGRQTFCPFMRQSITAAKAYKNMYEFLITNGCPKAMSCLEWIQSYFSLFDRTSIRYKIKVSEKIEKDVYDRKDKIRESRGKIVNKVVWKETESADETNKFLLYIGTSFASYMKHKERGKLDRRAIASAGMILRMFLKIIEDFHLELGKNIEGSTISMGGEEKKAKIVSSFVGATIENTSQCYIAQGTEDATKWNECLAPSAFAAMHKYLFNDEVRFPIEVPEARTTGKIFQRIAMMGNFLMACKQVQLGPGVLVQNSQYYKRIEWNDEDILMANHHTQQWYEEIKELITPDRNFIRASPGMLMGMLNAGSTTLGLLGTNHNMDPFKMRVVTLRSSDDSMSKYMTREAADVRDCIEMNRRNLGMIGINLSPDKTFFFPAELGEYTSWYMDGAFVAQYGVETASLRPQGKNPADDFFSMAKGTATALSTLTINHIGATARLRIGVDGIRRLWRIKRNPEKRPGISDSVLFLSDGGASPWNCCNCHLIEPCLKERAVRTDDERNYILKCLNPANPFTEDPVEDMVFSKEMGCLTTECVENPQTIFHFVRRSNRTITQDHQRQMFEEERRNMEAFEILKFADPTVLLEFPVTNIPISKHITEILHSLKNGSEMTEEDETLFRKTLNILEHGRGDSDTDDEDSEFEY